MGIKPAEQKPSLVSHAFVRETHLHPIYLPKNPERNGGSVETMQEKGRAVPTGNLGGAQEAGRANGDYQSTGAAWHAIVIHKKTSLLP